MMVIDRDRLIEIVKVNLMGNINKSCNLAENIVDDIIVSQREERESNDE